jgi:Fur family transcriptional regulator, ferric uptake regulator
MVIPYNSVALKVTLNQKGWRMTPQRQVILDLFCNLPKGEHLSAEEVHQRIQERGDKSSLSTVYRTLKLMAHLRILREMDLGEEHKNYELNETLQDSHHHLVCIRCTKTIEFKSETTRQIGAKLAKQEGYELLDCQLLIHGVCPTCRRSLV